MKNKLCCTLNPMGTCEGCGRKWCETCAEEINWNMGKSDHGALLPSPEELAKWICPIAGVVVFKPELLPNDINSIDDPWIFVPYKESI